MKKVLFHIVAIFSALCLAVSCSFGEKQAPDIGPERGSILFCAEMPGAVSSTRGQAPLDNVNLFSMGVFAGYEEEEENFSDSSPANDYIDNVRYTRSNIANPFAGAEVCYWPFSGKLSFFAYAPYITGRFLQFAPDYVSGYPRITYSPDADVSAQPDFCIADPVLDRHSAAEPVPLVFHHTLSQVMFSANYSGEIPPIVSSSSSLYVKVDSIRICNVIGKKTVVVGSGNPCFEWQDDAECPGSDRTGYLMARSSSQLRNQALPSATGGSFLDLTTTAGVANGVMYLIPQSMEDDELYLEVTYGYYESAGGNEILRASVTTICPLPEVEWLPVHAYRYKFTIDLASSAIVNPAVSVETWHDVDNTQSTPAHIE